jgi:hypothetical protein
MAKMRKIQPRLKELQERFADDRPRFTTEMMALYKRKGQSIGLSSYFADPGIYVLVLH